MSTAANPPAAERPYDVLIAGGSYAGLALAAALSHESGGDLRIAVVSPSFPALDLASTSADVRASALSRGSLNLLDTVGVWPVLQPDAQTVHAIELTDSALDDAVRRTVLTYDLDDHANDSAPPAMVIVENRRLGAALYEAAHSARGVTLMAQREITAHIVEHGLVRATVSPTESLFARLLVAADGSRSRLRAEAGIKTVGHPYGQTGIVTIVTPEHPHDGRAIQHFLPAGPFALLPMTGNRVCITWSETSAETTRILALDPAAFRAEVERRCAGSLGRIGNISPPKSWPLLLNVARSLIAPRLALIGDAAHTVHPIAGQGLNLGLRDVAALAETIIDAARLGLDIGHTTTLETYERLRRFDNLATATAFDTLNRVFSSQSTLLRSARDAAVGIADALPSLKSWLITEAGGATADAPRLLRSRQTSPPALTAG